MRPRRFYETLVESGNLRLLDGQFSFGQVLGTGGQAGKELCEETGPGIIALRNAGHLGRMAAGQNYWQTKGWSLSFCHCCRVTYCRPFGGKQARISTAPVAIGVPHQTDNSRTEHFILDFATSRVAEGKILVSQKTVQPCPQMRWLTARVRSKSRQPFMGPPQQEMSQTRGPETGRSRPASIKGPALFSL